jgi:Flp pilus assembly protein TadB
MDWITSLLNAALGGEPLVIFAVIVLAFVFLILRLGMRALKTIERINKIGD